MTEKNDNPAAAPMWWDGGDRAITAREKATIEEHGPSCFTIPLVPAIPAVRCGGCGDAIQPDAMLGTRCRCACSTEHQAGEVQGDARAALEAAMPYVETLHSIVGGEARASVWRCIERGRAALAATGSQQVGEESAGLPEMCRSSTNAQGIQVGEVPGDALVPVQPRALAASIAELEALMEGECLDPLTTSESESVMLVLQELKRLQLVAARHPVAQVPVEMTAEFTDTGRAAIAWVLWHHQGGSSPVGQPLRFALGMGQHDRMTDQQIAEAKRFAAWAGATTESFHRRSPAQGIDLGPGVRAIADERQRQVDAEGYNAENDADYKAGELANAALAYVEVAAMDLAAGGRSHIAMRAPPACWPWHRLWWKPRDARRDLVRAGALIAAQLDVIDSASDAAPGVE